MPLDVLGRTRVTLMDAASISPSPKGAGNLVKLHRAGDRPLQFFKTLFKGKNFAVE